MTRTEARYAKLRQQLERAEHELMKAARKWDRLRQRVRRAERTLDQEFNQRAGAGGKLDWRNPCGEPMDTYGIEYRLSNRHKWRKFSVTSKAPFSRDEIEAHRHDIANRNRVPWHSVQVRGTLNGAPIKA